MRAKTISDETIDDPKHVNSNCSRLSLDRVRVQRGSFIDCDFRGAFQTKGSIASCKFEQCDFAGAHFGHETSHFADCNFSRCRFTAASFGNAIFEHSSFIDCRLNGVDFSASGFWDCVFSGPLVDVTFRGNYQFASDRAIHVPSKTGLHRVSFKNAKLRWIDVKNSCSIEDIALPPDGSVLCVSREQLERAKEAVSGALKAKSEEAEVDKFGDIFLSRVDQEYFILARSDFTETLGKHLGNLFFDEVRIEST